MLSRGVNIWNNPSQFAVFFGSSAFVSTWDTENLGGTGSATKVILLPMTAGVEVDWGDGTVNNLNTHTYSVGGVKTITINETVTGFRFNNGGDKSKLISIVDAAALVIDNSNMFLGCNNGLTADFSTVSDITMTNISSMFNGWTAGISLDLTGLTEKAFTDISSMFRFSRASMIITGLEDFNVTALTTANLMLQGVTLPTSQYSSLLINYEAQAVQDGVPLNGGNSLYSAGAAATARADLIADHTWTITDGGQEP